MKTFRWLAALACFAAFLLLQPGQARVEALAGFFIARVVRVSDGDTIEVVRGNDTLGIVKIRLYGLDAPESGQAHGKKARQAIRKLVDKQLVRIEIIQESDKYGRIVGIVSTEDGRDAGLQLIESGYAWFYPNYCKGNSVCDQYRDAEIRAREARRGLWQDKSPIPPWEWRRMQKAMVVQRSR